MKKYRVIVFVKRYWGRWLTADNLAYLNPEDINDLNLFAYCGMH